MKRIMLAVGLTVAVWSSGLRAQGMSYSGMRHHVYTLTVPEGRDRWNGPPILMERADDSQAFAADELLAPALALTAAAQKLPQDLHSIEFCTFARDPTTVAICVDSEHAPMWDDLYAQSFTIHDVSNVLYNAGMLSLNPADAPPRGSGESRIAVPDPDGGKFIIPAPAGVLLGAWGVLVTGWLRLRRRL